MQFFSSVKRTALISVQPNHPQMLQKHSSFALITHELLEKQQNSDLAAMHIMRTQVS